MCMYDPMSIPMHVHMYQHSVWPCMPYIRHSCVQMAICLVLLSSIVLMFISGVRSARAGSWRKRRTQFRKIMQV